ncbi:DMT family transporter [Acinetobacter bereziniae]|uniref:DMT family transporter n=1 Tax=Acinetobacter bereziniae TaxID=106648 RepID=UPI002953E2CD|nr:DMT family transporter [Acinetobacter bereziniae]MDV8154453.1 DMT family transporter [Acinetobacter bereziniae]
MHTKKIVWADFTIYLKLTCVAMLWGGTFIAGRVIAFEMPAQIAALMRFIVASILLMIILIKVEGSFKTINLKQHFLTACMGLTGVFAYNIFFFGALSHMQAGRTALFVSLSPILTIIAARIFFKEELSKFNYFGVVLAFFGTLLIVTKGHLFSQLNTSFGTGELMMSCAVLSWVAYTLLCKKIAGLSPLIITTYSTLWGLFFLSMSFIPYLRQWQSFTFHASIYLSVLYLGALGTVLAFVWYAQGIAKIGTSRTIIFNNLVPLFAVLLAFLLLNEPITVVMLVGGAMSFIGVLMTNKKPLNWHDTRYSTDKSANQNRIGLN